MTHRCFSRNASSSRAIPIEKMIQDIQDERAEFEFWGSNQKGMQSEKELTGDSLNDAIHYWDVACRNALLSARSLNYSGAHKQIVNRVLEPFSHITVIATSSEDGLRNFFALRAHKDAQPEFQVLAYKMLKLWLSNKPESLLWGEWHMPFCDPNRGKDALKISTGRIARVSYLTHDGLRDPAKDIELHDRLIESGHMSPFEHCAQARLISPDQLSNFGSDWLQYRKMISNECKYITNIELEQRLASRPHWVKL